MTLALEVKGVEEARKAINIDVTGQLERAIDTLLPILVRKAAEATPVVTGSMRAAWRGKRKGVLGRLHIDPSARNIRSGVLVTSYAAEVSDRRGVLRHVYSAAGPSADKALKKEVGFGGNK